MGRHFSSNGITVLIVALIGIALLLEWGRTSMTAVGPLAEDTVIVIPSGATAKTITNILVDNGVVSSGWLFNVALNYRGLEESLKQGVYSVDAGVSIDEIATQLNEGKGGTRYQATFRLRAEGISPRLLDRVEATNFADETPEQVMERITALTQGNESLELRVAVPEGLTSFQVVEGLKAVSFMQGDIALVPPEGALSPNTFSIRNGSDRQALIDQMIAEQRSILASTWESRAGDLPLESAEELLILASIIEKETGVSSERGLVSSIFINRLNQGMLLQTDPTVIYGITLGKEVLGRGLRRSELNAATPYNTYVISGLPPTPIANPGRLAIEAAAHPDTSDFIFFVADGSGGHAFARTLVEHEANVVRWREIERQRAAE